MESEQSKSQEGGTIKATDHKEHTRGRREVEGEQSKSQESSTTRVTDKKGHSHLQHRMAVTTLPSRESHGAHPGSHSDEGGRGGMQDRLEAEARREQGRYRTPVGSDPSRDVSFFSR